MLIVRELSCTEHLKIKTRISKEKQIKLSVYNPAHHNTKHWNIISSVYNYVNGKDEIDPHS